MASATALHACLLELLQGQSLLRQSLGGGLGGSVFFTGRSESRSSRAEISCDVRVSSPVMLESEVGVRSITPLNYACAAGHELLGLPRQHLRPWKQNNLENAKKGHLRDKQKRKQAQAFSLSLSLSLSCKTCVLKRRNPCVLNNAFRGRARGVS